MKYTIIFLGITFVIAGISNAIESTYGDSLIGIALVLGFGTMIHYMLYLFATKRKADEENQARRDSNNI